MAATKLKEVAFLVGVLGALAVWFLVCLQPRSPSRDSPSLRCRNNLSQIYYFAYGYAQKHGYFPAAGSGHAHDALNDLLAESPGDLDTDFFRCPLGEAVHVDQGAGGARVLGPRTLDYAWITSKASSDGPSVPLASDKYVDGYQDSEGTHYGHKSGMNVLFTDGSVRWIKMDQLPPGSLLPGGLTR